jgi:hypothetical protein
MLVELQEMARELRRELGRIEPDRVTTSQAAAILEAAAEVERLAGSLKLLVASRACKSRKWAAEGHRSPASWIAEKSKGSFGDALSTLETSRRLRELSDTADALRSGELSRSQAKEVTEAASTDPNAQRDLLQVASEGNMKKLKDRARDVVTRSSSRKSELERYRAIHRGRYLRHWSDIDGGFRLDARLTPDSGARLLASIQAETDALLGASTGSGDNKSQQTKDSVLACRADALVILVGRGSQSPPERRRRGSSAPTTSDTVVVRVDASALRRGHAKNGEACEIPGVGRVPVATAERFLGNAFLKILVRDGVDVTTVCHAGRSIPSHVQSALEERDPVCVVPGCEVANGLECHHWEQNFADSGTTTLEGLARVCKRHHDKITYEGFALKGGPGHWKMVAPRGAGPPRQDSS